MRITERIVAAAGLCLLAVGALARQPWLDAHVLPSFFLPRAWYVEIEWTVRAGFAATGLLLVIFRRWLARAMSLNPATAIAAAVAAVLALAAGEVALRQLRMRPAEWLREAEQPLRIPDARTGWTFAPNRTAVVAAGGRDVEYSLDGSGYRVRTVAEPVDLNRPALVFIGESIVFGDGLAWPETVPAQVSTRLGVPSANLAVHGFSTDQAYLRLAAELPRFRHPLAVVGIFVTALFGRNLDDDRPHLGPGLAWLPAEPHGRVASLAKLLVPFRRERTIDRGVEVTREVLRAIDARARACGAVPLIVVPQFGPESAAERTLRHRIFDDAGVPNVFVEFESGWRLPGNLHPNARAAAAMAMAVADRLRAVTVTGRNPL